MIDANPFVSIATGHHPEAIKRRIGHRSITVTTAVYGHLFPSDAESLAARIDDVFRSGVDKMWTEDSDNVIQLPTQYNKTPVKHGVLSGGPGRT